MCVLFVVCTCACLESDIVRVYDAGCRVQNREGVCVCVCVYVRTCARLELGHVIGFRV